MSAPIKTIAVIIVSMFLLTGCGDGQSISQYHAKEFKKNADRLGWDCTITSSTQRRGGSIGLCEYDKGEFHCIAQVRSSYDELVITDRPQCVSHRTGDKAKVAKSSDS